VLARPALALVLAHWLGSFDLEKAEIHSIRIPFPPSDATTAITHDQGLEACRVDAPVGQLLLDPVGSSLGKPRLATVGAE
jgi:hypothetical protein